MDPAEDELVALVVGSDPLAPSCSPWSGPHGSSPRVPGQVHAGRYAAPGRPRAPTSPALGGLVGGGRPAAHGHGPARPEPMLGPRRVPPAPRGGWRADPEGDWSGRSRPAWTPYTGPGNPEPARSGRSGPLLGDRRGLGGPPGRRRFPALGGPRPSVGQHPRARARPRRDRPAGCRQQRRLLPRLGARGRQLRSLRSPPQRSCAWRRNATDCRSTGPRGGTAHRHGGRPAPDRRRRRATAQGGPRRRRPGRRAATCGPDRPAQPGPGQALPRRRRDRRRDDPQVGGSSRTGRAIPLSARPAALASRRADRDDLRLSMGRRACRARRPAPGHVVRLRRGRAG